MTLPALGWGHVVAVTVPVVVIQCFLLYADAISGATAGLIDPSPSIDPDEWISLAILLVALIIIKIVILAAMSRRLLKFNGGSVDDYATLSTPTLSPSC